MSLNQLDLDNFVDAVKVNNFGGAAALLPKLKIICTTFTFTENQQGIYEKIFHRTLLENACLYYVKIKDILGFNRNFAQVKQYYDEKHTSILSPSQNHLLILGLNLLHLLSSNQLPDFHTELELIPVEMHKDPHIRHPIQFEQYLMEGAYNKLWSSRADVPSETYTVFMDMMFTTVRYIIPFNFYNLNNLII
eukprot:TRINITY_DN1765_c0_g1_i2.p1 TRINITY_DN1765_c0_g1~~TRINITY_DN1765_c0_g1_i2.p1  ORF type:complete len:192 (-),score=59.98 TRINITY_DN1765_c0_g1_i2:31-606(-)